MTTSILDTVRANCETLDDLVDWDVPFTVVTPLSEHAAYIEPRVLDLFEPDCYIECDEDGQILPGALATAQTDLVRQGWNPFGQSGQQGGGWLFHASETLGGNLADLVLNTPGTYVLIEPRALYPETVDEEDAAMLDASPLGWLLLERLEVEA